MNLLSATMVFLASSGIAADQTGEPVPALPAVQEWLKFTDPQEGAFRVDMPLNWKVSGGTIRRSALQYRSWGNAISPDGATILAINDPTEGSHVVPTPLLAVAGFPEGSLYNDGHGNVYNVAPYQSGQRFAVSWGQRKLAERCRAIKVTGNRSRPDVTQQINVYSGQFGITYDVGEATFTCERGGLNMTAYVFASTTYIGQPGTPGGIWYADRIEAFLAPTQVAGMAAGLLAHMVSSIEINPVWLTKQVGMNADVSRIAAQTNAVISNSIMRGWEERGTSMDRVMEEDSRARLGIDIYADPGTGTKYTVGNNHRYYWVNPSGTVLGTDTDTPPNASFTRLNRVPP